MSKDKVNKSTIFATIYVLEAIRRVISVKSCLKIRVAMKSEVIKVAAQ